VELISLVVLGLVIGGAIAGAAAVVRSFLPVSYDRAGQFVQRTGVELTRTNALYVVDAIARTRRWRAAFLLLATAGWISWNMAAGTADLTIATGVAFAAAVLGGTVLGELRNASARASGPRAASLTARQEPQYVGAWARRTPLLLAVVATVLLPVDLVVSDAHWLVVALAVAAVGAWAVGRWAARFVVDRPRPVDADSSVIAADDGLRSRALHAIGAAAVLAAGWGAVVLAVLPLLGPTEEQTDSPWAVLAWMVLGGIAWAAWKRGSAPFLVVVPEAAPQPGSVVGAEGGAER
jgi:hypothetical protein